MNSKSDSGYSQLNLFFQQKKEQARSRMPNARRGIGYTLAGEHFQTKSDILDKAQKILVRCPLGASVSEDDATFLRELVAQHPEADEKIGCGIASFEVEQNPEYHGGTRVFMITRTDGTRDHFSYRKCINPPSRKSIFTMICRRLIASQLNARKEAYYRLQSLLPDVAPCEYTGEMTHWRDAHVDHIPPDTFAALIARFIEKYHIDPGEVEMIAGDPRGFTKVFASHALEEQWMQFHRENARLRVVSSYANLHLIPKGLPPDYNDAQKKVD